MKLINIIIILGTSQYAIASDMAEISAGKYRPLYLNPSSPIVSVTAFKIDKKPVSNQDFFQFIQTQPQWQRDKIPTIFAEKEYLQHWEKTQTGFMPRKEDLNKPVVFVSWFAAQAYCQAQNKQLPTVAQWEYVAQASLSEKNGSKESDYNQIILNWYAKSARSQIGEIAQRAPNYWGMYDLHGLIWEWVGNFNSNLVTGESRGDSNLDAQLFCGSGAAGSSDPSNYAAFMRYGFRSSLKAKYTLNSLGFRCAQETPTNRRTK